MSMRNRAKLFVIYFPVILIVLQVLLNIFFFIAPDLYMKYGFYLSLFVGTNVLFAVFLALFTFLLRFCEISRWAAIAELAFAINYLVVQQDNLYNIMFQIIVGVIAIILTFRHYMRKFPLCRLSLFMTFVGHVLQSGSCSEGLSKWERGVKDKILKHHVTSRNGL
jgi:hypothetical protein